MPINYAAPTMLLDRDVCVARRARIGDGMGGTFQEYLPIIPRYCVRIYPDHHQRRRAVELGERANETTHRAIGHPATNGKTIMIGDRFFDSKNNLVYDVVEVHRSRHASPYNAMHQFSLTIVTDDVSPCGAEVS
jgi:hypothetical protein